MPLKLVSVSLTLIFSNSNMYCGKGIKKILILKKSQKRKKVERENKIVKLIVQLII